MDTTIILLIVNVFAAVAVIALTLIQQPKGDMGSAFGGGGSQSMFGSRGSANFLTKSTAWMCFVFFASSLMLAYMYAQTGEDDSVVGQSVIEEVSDLPQIVGASSAEDGSSNASSDLPAVPVQEQSEQIESVIQEVSESELSESANGANSSAIENKVEQVIEEQVSQ